jgi:hypothetical protein
MRYPDYISPIRIAVIAVKQANNLHCARRNYGVACLSCRQRTSDFARCSACSDYGIARLSSTERTDDFYGTSGNYGVARLGCRQDTREIASRQLTRRRERVARLRRRQDARVP